MGRERLKSRWPPGQKRLTLPCPTGIGIGMADLHAQPGLPGQPGSALHIGGTVPRQHEFTGPLRYAVPLIVVRGTHPADARLCFDIHGRTIVRHLCCFSVMGIREGFGQS